MKLKYRPEIDGLRCIAVMVVILHHLNVPAFGGGFVGVDVFFVISGYLITGIILAELKAKKFNFGSFYKRRVIRLAPAYFIVLLTTSVFAYLLMLPGELHDFSVSALYSTFFAANFYMWEAVGGYFDTGTDTTPLLHLWSLAVEEQFYFIWPVTMLLLYKLVRGKMDFLIAMVVVAFFVGLAISEYGAVNFRSASYYLMPTRAFELLIGAVLAVMPPAVFDRVPKLGRLLLCLIGLGMIIYGNVLFTEETWFPGLNALFPCVGAALLIAFARPNTPFLGKLLASAPAVRVGKISYPAYLWHWPIIAFLNLQLVELTPLVCVAVIIGTLLLAALTYQFVEMPVRKFRRFRWRAVVGVGFVVPALFFSTAGLAVIEQNGLPERFNNGVTDKARALDSWAHEIRGDCHTTGRTSRPLLADECIVGKRNDRVDFLIVGDSHANHFVGMLDVFASHAGLRGYDVTQDSTPFLVDVYRYYVDRGEVVEDSKFRSRNEFIERELLSDSWDLVVLGGNYRSYLENGLFSWNPSGPAESSPEIFVDAMIRSIDLVIQHGAVPVLISGNPTFDSDISSCTLSNLRFDLERICHQTRDQYEQTYREWNEFVEKLREQFDQLVIIDPAKVMCDASWCYSELSGVPLYKDGGHLNYEGSKLIGQLYIEQFGNPFSAVTIGRSEQ